MSERKVLCPRCHKPSLFNSENIYRPFCTERCKMIDLGNWADGSYAIPVKGNVEAAPEAASTETIADEIDDEE